MPVTVSDTAYETQSNKTIPDADFWKVGIEFEYPLALNPADAPATRARNSSTFRDYARRDGTTTRGWHLENYDDGGAPRGHVDSDHVGAEITSQILDLHSNHPEKWYRATIAKATDMGYPHAGCGYGSTTFGLHMHVSDFSAEYAEAHREHVTEDWAPTFFCASILENSLDPWRSGGIRSSEFADGYNTSRTSSSAANRYNNGHYELRLFEPGVPEHVDMMLEYLRLFEREDPDAARQYARQAVYTADLRLTPVQQAILYDERNDDWPTEEAIRSGTRAEWFYENVYQPHIA